MMTIKAPSQTRLQKGKTIRKFMKTCRKIFFLLNALLSQNLKLSPKFKEQTHTKDFTKTTKIRQCECKLSKAITGKKAKKFLKLNALSCPILMNTKQTDQDLLRSFIMT